ncbi:MAG TPA: hypothetical protein VGG28_32370 [Kofleriaceae bacterium]|jgi:hypothetical protein
MLVVFGTRSYGRIDAHGGEHAMTRFAHVYYLPIIPVSSMWVMGDRGFAIRTSGKSIAAAYLRVWAPLIAICVLLTASIAGTIIAAVLAAASAWAWRSRGLRQSAMRASDFRLLAFGTRCDPAWMTSSLRDDMKRALDERWAKLDAQRAPDEVAERGATSSREAVVAYGLLAIAALDAPDAGARATAASNARRILDGSHDLAGDAAGPYRGGDQAANAAVLAEVTRAANDLSATKQHAPRRTIPPAAKWLFGAVCAFAAVGALLGTHTALSPRAVSIDDVNGARFDGELVVLHCDSTRELGALRDDTPIYGCSIGDDVVMLVGHVDDDDAVGGRLLPMNAAISAELFDSRDSSLALRYLRVESLTVTRDVAIGSIVVLVLLAGWLASAIVRRSKHSE